MKLPGRRAVVHERVGITFFHLHPVGRFNIFARLGTQVLTGGVPEKIFLI
jgi:hypothetical protein